MSSTCWAGTDIPPYSPRLGRATGRRLVLLLLALCLACGAHAQGRKTDTITLYNGDRVTGEIKSLEGGILTVSTNSMGTLKIEWPEVAAVESSFRYALRLSDGSRMFGSLGEKADSGQVVLVTPSGEFPLDSLEVVEIRQLDDKFLDRIDLYLSATFGYTRASDIAQISLKSEVSYENEHSLNTLNLRDDGTRTPDKNTSSARIDLQRKVWSERRTKQFRALYANFESNDEFNLDNRVGIGAGLGRYFVDSYRTNLTGAAGAQVVTEQDADSARKQEVELFLGASFATWKFGTPEMDLLLRSGIYPSVTRAGRVRSNSELRLRWELIEDFYWDVSGWLTTDNQSETGQTSDYGLTTGVGWTY